MASPAEVDIGTLIERREGVYGGRPVLKGTRFPVSMIGVLVREGLTADEIHSEYAYHVDKALVYAGIAYYLANKEAIDAQIEQDQREHDEAARADREARPDVFPREA